MAWTLTIDGLGSFEVADDVSRDEAIRTIEQQFGVTLSVPAEEPGAPPAVQADPQKGDTSLGRAFGAGLLDVIGLGQSGLANLADVANLKDQQSALDRAASRQMQESNQFAGPMGDAWEQLTSGDVGGFLPHVVRGAGTSAPSLVFPAVGAGLGFLTPVPGGAAIGAGIGGALGAGLEGLLLMGESRQQAREAGIEDPHAGRHALAGGAGAGLSALSAARFIRPFLHGAPEGAGVVRRAVGHGARTLLTEGAEEAGQEILVQGATKQELGAGFLPSYGQVLTDPEAMKQVALEGLIGGILGGGIGTVTGPFIQPEGGEGAPSPAQPSGRFEEISHPDIEKALGRQVQFTSPQDQTTQVGTLLSIGRLDGSPVAQVQTPDRRVYQVSPTSLRPAPQPPSAPQSAPIATPPAATPGPSPAIPPAQAVPPQRTRGRPRTQPAQPGRPVSPEAALRRFERELATLRNKIAAIPQPATTPAQTAPQARTEAGTVRRKYGRGPRGGVILELPDSLHEELLRLRPHDQASAERIAEQTGLSKKTVFARAKRYQDTVRQGAHPLSRGETYRAPVVIEPKSGEEPKEEIKRVLTGPRERIPYMQETRPETQIEAVFDDPLDWHVYNARAKKPHGREEPKWLGPTKHRSLAEQLGVETGEVPAIISRYRRAVDSMAQEAGPGAEFRAPPVRDFLSPPPTKPSTIEEVEDAGEQRELPADREEVREQEEVAPEEEQVQEAQESPEVREAVETTEGGGPEVSVPQEESVSPLEIPDFLRRTPPETTSDTREERARKAFVSPERQTELVNLFNALADNVLGPSRGPMFTGTQEELLGSAAQTREGSVSVARYWPTADTIGLAADLDLTNRAAVYNYAHEVFHPLQHYVLARDPSLWGTLMDDMPVLSEIAESVVGPRIMESYGHDPWEIQAIAFGDFVRRKVFNEPDHPAWTREGRAPSRNVFQRMWDFFKSLADGLKKRKLTSKDVFNSAYLGEFRKSYATYRTGDPVYKSQMRVMDSLYSTKPPNPTPSQEVPLHNQNWLTNTGKFLAYTINTPLHRAITSPWFSPIYYMAEMAREVRSKMNSELGKLLRPHADFIRANPSARGRVRAFMELADIQGEALNVTTNPNTGERMATVVNRTGQAHLSNKGDVVRLVGDEVEAVQAVKNSMDYVLDSMREALLYQAGLPTNAQLTADVLRKLAADMLTRKQINKVKADEWKGIANQLNQFEQLKKQFYMPHIRDGNIGLYATGLDAKGKTVKINYSQIYGDLNSGKTKREIKAWQDQTKNYAAQNLGLDPATVKFKTFNVADEVHTRDPDLMNVLSSLDSLTSMFSPDAAKAYKAMRPEVTKRLLESGFAAHLMNRENIPGYSTDFDKAIMRYGSASSNFIAHLRHDRGMNAQLEQIGRNFGTNSKEYQYTNRWVDHLRSGNSDWAQARAIVTAWFLGARPSAALIQYATLPMLVGPKLAQYSSTPKAAAEVTKAHKDVGKIMGKVGWKVFSEAGQYLTGGSRKNASILFSGTDTRVPFFDPAAGKSFLTPDEYEYFNEAFKRGVTNAEFVLDVSGLSEDADVSAIERLYDAHYNKRWGRKFINKLMIAFGFMETTSRSITALAAYRTGTKLGEDGIYQAVGHNPLYQEKVKQGQSPASAFADLMVMETFGAWGKANRPEYMYGWGAIGAPIFQFAQYPQFMAEIMWRAVKQSAKGGNRKDAMRALGLMLGVAFLAGGMEGLPFAKTLLEFANLLRRMSGYSIDYSHELKNLFREEWGMSDDLADAVLKGASRPYVGVDIGQRVTVGNFPLFEPVIAIGDIATGGRTVDPADLLGAGASALFRGANRGITRWHNGDPYFWTEFVPLVVKDITAATLEWRKQGAFSISGNRLFLPVKGDADVPDNWRFKESDLVWKLFGFTPARKARVTEEIFAEQLEARRVREKTDWFRERLVRAYTASHDTAIARDSQRLKETSQEIGKIINEIREHNKEVMADPNFRATELIILDLNSVMMESLLNMAPELRDLYRARDQYLIQKYKK